MIFTSYTYVAFLLLVFVLHWSVPVAWRKPVLIVASYVFYCSWQWQFGFLLLGVSLFNWAYCRWVLQRWPDKGALLLGVLVNFLPLLYYKYSNFLIGNATTVANWFQAGWEPLVLNVILPLGISFFTFQGIAYQVDVATGDEPIEKLFDFLLFKAFWPQLIAGPIIRIHEIREQLESPRTLNYDDLAAGGSLILFGFFKKVVLADNLAPVVDMVFTFKGTPNALDCLIGILGFGMQIYFDFSAYSDIAIGSARLFGYRFPNNFNWPYAASSPQEFWNRWHMTLSRWIRDYIFTPLSLSTRDRPSLGMVWLLVAMAICGLWHGAQWTFVIWGIWHGALLVANQTVLKRVFPRPAAANEPVFRWRFLPASVLTFALVSLGWLFFRAQSLAQCRVFLESMATLRGGWRPSVLRENSVLLVVGIFLGMTALHLLRDPGQKFAASEWLGLRSRTVCKSLVYAAIVLLVIVFDREAKSFVYFQF